MITDQVLKNLSVLIKGKREGRKGDVRRKAASREAMEKRRYVRIIERKGVKGDNPIEYFLAGGSEVPFESQKG